MTEKMSAAARRVRAALEEKGYGFRIMELTESTRTAEEAARAVGCAVGQIAKSLVFKGKRTKEPLLVITSGANRVSEVRLAELAGEKVGMAKPDLVRKVTGFAIGGVPPVGHVVAMRTWIDAHLLDFDVIWAAAGTPNAMFELPSADLPRITGGTVAAVS